MKASRIIQRILDGIRGSGDVPSKRVKQQAFDSLRAPVSGW